MPRLDRASSTAPEEGALAPASPIDPQGTVLITGGTGRLGGLLARHLVQAHDLGSVLLVSRRGAAADGASELEAELLELGAQVRIAACDVSEREECERLLELVPAAHPLTAVIHAAGVLDDGVIASLDGERLTRVLAPKLDAAWHLHELTRQLDLQAFVLFSSAAGIGGSPGQGNYAAANAFLDALAAHRRSRGLAATSLAWGLWAEGSDMSDQLDGAGRARLGRMGVNALGTEEGMELFDAALATSRALLVPLRLDLPALRTAANAGMLPPLMRVLLPASQQPLDAALVGLLARRLSEAPAQEREQLALAAVRAEAAAVLGHASAEAVDAQRAFLELGFDSLTAVELCGRLSILTGLQLPPTLVFEHATSRALSEHLVAQVGLGGFSAGDGTGNGAGNGAGNGTGSGAGNGAAPAPRAAGGDSSPAGEARDTLCAMFLQAQSSGKAAEFMDVLTNASRFRASFELPLDPEQAPRPLRLAQGDSSPSLICLPSILANSGPHQYARYARASRGVRDVWALTNPGFDAGETLPASVPAAVETLAQMVLAAAGDAPFVLVGHSTGGLLAHALAAHLEGSGVPAAAVVLLDTYVLQRTTLSHLHPLVGAMFTAQGAAAAMNDTRLTAMGAYFGLLADWRPAELASPTLLVKAAEPLSGVSGDGEDWQPSWELPHTALETAGDHFSMMVEQSESTACAVEEWLAGGLVLG